MPRVVPNTAQNLLSSVVLPLLSLLLLPVSLVAVAACILKDRIGGGHESRIATSQGHKRAPGCVMISGGRMSKGLHLARAFKRAGWKVIGVEEEGWGEYCPMRFSKAIDQFYILPPAAQSYESYSTRLIAIAQQHSVTLFIPVSGAGNSVEDARAAEEMAAETKGRCRTWIQDPETMLDLHDKDRFMALVERFGMLTPKGRMVTSTSEALAFLMEEGPKDGQGREPKYILKCMDLDENRGDMTLYPLKGDDVGLSSTRKMLEGLRLKITKECPYVFQEFIPGQEWCTHASVLLGQVTAFVTCPSNDMLMTYENATSEVVGKQAEEWTRKLLAKLQQDPTPNGEPRRLTGHFSFDFIQSTKDGQLYPLECNARVHTAVILLPLSKLASCYDPQYQSRSEETLRPNPKTAPRSWIYNDLIMRYLPLLVPSHDLLSYIHASLPASAVVKRGIRPSEEPVNWRVDPSLIADDWIPFIVLWHVFWPIMLLTRWWQGKKWTRLNVSTGRIFEA